MILLKYQVKLGKDELACGDCQFSTNLNKNEDTDQIYYYCPWQGCIHEGAKKPLNQKNIS